MNDAEVREFTRRMDWLYLARDLARTEETARGILSCPADDRQEEARQALDLVERIRRHRHLGFDTSLLVQELNRLTQASNDRLLRPLVDIGAKVQDGGKKGADSAHGAASAREEKRRRLVAAFKEARKSTTSDWGACGAVARQFGVSPRTVYRACQSCGVL